MQKTIFHIHLQCYKVYDKAVHMIIACLEFQYGLIMDPCSLMVLVCNVILFDVLLLAMYIILVVKKIPAIKEKLEIKWMGLNSQREEDSQTSVSNANTMKKKIMSVDNVIFEAE